MAILPMAPTNVRGIVNGIEYPMRLHYAGLNGLGVHVWHAHWPDGVEAPRFEDFGGGKCDLLPAHTSVAFSIQHESDPFPDWMPPLDL